MPYTISEFKQTRYISRKSVSGFEPGTDGFSMHAYKYDVREEKRLGNEFYKTWLLEKVIFKCYIWLCADH
jgi:hypothetical protein